MITKFNIVQPKVQIEQAMAMFAKIIVDQRGIVNGSEKKTWFYELCQAQGFLYRATKRLDKCLDKLPKEIGEEEEDEEEI